MRLLKATVRPDCEIALLGDTHIGTSLVHDDGIHQAIDWLRSGKNRYFCFMGDEIEGRTIDHPYFHLQTSTEPVPTKQRKMVESLFGPVAKKCLVWLYGNHPKCLERTGNLTAELCENLGIPYGTWTTILTLANKKGIALNKWFLCHGGRNRIASNAKDYEQQQANMKAALKMCLREKASDVHLMAMGHTHKLLVCEPSNKLLLTSDESHIKQSYLSGIKTMDSYIPPDQRWYVNTGSFHKLYEDGVDSYAEVAGYDPIELGYAVVTMQGGHIANIRKVVV